MRSGELISRPAQVRALVAPTRQEIIDALESAGPRSVAELAALLGRAPDSLYFHLRSLVKVGLVVESGRRKSGRHVAALYDAAVRPMQLSYAPPVRPDHVAAVVGAAMRLGLRDFRRAIADAPAPAAVLPGPRRTAWGARSKGWVTPGQLARINELLSELSGIIRTGRPSENTVPIGLSFVLSPSPPSPRGSRAVARTSHPVQSIKGAH